MRAALAALLALPALLALAACEGTVGTIEIELVTAPGADPLAEVTTVRLTLDQPAAVVERERDPSGGFDLELEVTAEGAAGFITFEGLDADRRVLAWGRSGVLPIAAIDLTLRIYVAAPGSLAAAPVAFDPPRAEVRAAPLPFGLLWAGGRGPDGAPLDTLTIYNVYSHDFQQGDPLPAPRAAITAGAGLFDFVYLFGGRDAAGDPTGTFWRFDTQAAPAGDYRELDGDEALARAGARAALIGTERLLVSGTPGVLLDGSFGRATAVDTEVPLDGVPVTLVLDELGVEVLIAGPGGVALFDGGAWVALEAPAAAARDGHAVVALPGGDALIVGGADGDELLTSAVLYERAERRFTVIDGFLSTPRRDAAVARAGDRVLVAGGTGADGAVLADAEIFAADSLLPAGTASLVVPRTGADAAALGNGQIAVAGGTDADGEPIATLELFTP